MNWKRILLIAFISFIVISLLGWIILKLDLINLDGGAGFEALSENDCTKLGCPYFTEYVGSINSDKYYACDCRYANQVKPENIICFTSKEDAESQDYVSADC